MIGSTISHYTVTEELGRGGMGVVYKAEDTRLKRTVAVKTLPHQGFGGGDELNRFGREAQAAAALNHPHIATVYEIDEEEGQSFIVMEYVDGPSLRDRIDEGPLKLEEAVRLAIQVASGLEAAHEQGIVHRDIKPANVMLTKKGESKIMDFGLAKLSDQTTMTKAGTTLGTAAYMSPEQARGEKVDHRSDIFALGVVIYEMITGQSAFKGAYAEAIVYSILNVDPEPITALRTGVSMELERVVGKALEKNPNERYQGMSDLLVDLRALEKTSLSSGSGTVKTSSIQSTPSQAKRTDVLPWMVAAVLLLVAIVALWRPWSSPENEPVVTKMPYQLPIGQSLSGHGSAVAISRDGSKMVYTAISDGVKLLYLKEIDSFVAEPIPGTEAGFSPFFSPDGNWIGFFQDNEIKKTSLSGGNPQSIVAASSCGASWSTDDQVVFYAGIGHGLQRVSANGGTPEILTSRETHFLEGEHFHCWPQVLPGNQAILFSAMGVGQGSRVSVLLLETGERRTLIENASYARYVDTGHVVFSRQGELLAVPFDLDNLKISGSPVTVVEGVVTEPQSEVRAAHYAISENGTLAYVFGTDRYEVGQLISAPPAETINAFPFSGQFAGMRISPDEQEIVAATLTGDIWIGNIERGDARRMTDELGGEYWPIWSNDGSYILFASDRHGGTAVNIYRMPADGSGEPERLIASDFHMQPQSFSPDGAVLAITKLSEQRTGHDILLVDMENGFHLSPFLQTMSNESHPSFSPSGHWIAYSSDQSGQREIYMRPYPGPGAVIPVSIGGGTEPTWSKDGRRLFYRDIEGNRISVVSVIEGNPPSVSRREIAIEGEYFEGADWGRTYDVWPDGSRFLLIDESDQNDELTQINVVFHWFEELERMVSRSN